MKELRRLAQARYEAEVELLVCIKEADAVYQSMNDYWKHQQSGAE